MGVRAEHRSYAFRRPADAVIGNGGCPVSVVYSNGAATCEIELGDDWRVSLQDGLMDGLHAWFKADNVRIIY